MNLGLRELWWVAYQPPMPELRQGLLSVIPLVTRYKWRYVFEDDAVEVPVADDEVIEVTTTQVLATERWVTFDGWCRTAIRIG